MKHWPLGLAIALTLVFVFALPSGLPPHPPMREADALPLYATRAGRACDNCHTNPTEWKNPAMIWRKCSLSCGSCHVSPTGGGLRNVAGRFYGQATLPMLFASHRGYKDWDRHMIPAAKRLELKRRNRLVDPAVGTTPYSRDWPMSLSESRYAGLRANPILLFGLDMRLALWGNRSTVRVFPMQLDAHIMLKPVRHLTMVATGGVLAKSTGFTGTFRDRLFVGVRDVYVMTSEYPLNLYLRAGRFVPPFGTNVDDHTTPTRRHFELDGSRLDSRVTAVEIGMAPNYPYLNIAVFQPNPGNVIPRHDTPAFFGVPGWGIAASAGWRDLGWQIGASVMFKRRKLSDGGDMDAYSLQWGLNPLYWTKWFPVTYFGELAAGRVQREGSSSFGWRLAMFHEIDVLIFNGFNLQLKYDYYDADLEVRDDHYQRVTIGLDWIVLPGLGIKTQARMQFQPGVGVQADGLLYLRGWW